MIYKRDITTTAEFQPTIVKIDDSGWYWINKPDQKWKRGNHTYDYPRDIPSCLLEVTLLRPELDYT